MNQCRWALAAAVLGLCVTGAAAQENGENLPGWRIADICRQDSAEGQCRLYEDVARQEVISSWSIIPPEWRESCLLSFKAPLEPSWRILADCIDAQAAAVRAARIKAIDDRSR